MSVNWIDLPGLANLRDVAGRTTNDGRVVQPKRLLRSDNLQGLPEQTVRSLVNHQHVTDVIDLRRADERAGEGPGSLDSQAITFHRISLYADSDVSETGLPDTDAEQARQEDAELATLVAARPEYDEHTTRLAAHYLVHYIRNGEPKIVAALRAIANASGATLVHCAAGKDRTGTIIALALTLAGVPRAQVLADYEATNDRLEHIMTRLRAANSYPETRGQDPREQSTPSATMMLLLSGIDSQYGGVAEYLRTAGWTDADTEALRRKLLDPAG